MRSSDPAFRLLLIALVLLCLLPAWYVHGAPDGGARVTELLWMGSDASSSDEWAEVGCPPSADGACDISGWTLSVMNSAGADALLIRFATGTIITPGEGIIVARNDAAASRLLSEPFVVVSSLTLANSKLRVTLRDAAGDIADIADDGTGSPLAGANPSGGMHRASMERVRFDLPGGDAAAWRTAEERVGFDADAQTFGNPGIVREIHPSVFSACGTIDPVIDVQSGDVSGVRTLTINLQALGVPKDAVCLWDYGDGFASTSCNPPSHTFRDIGSFAIRLGVTDACGLLTERSLRVEVREHNDEPDRLCVPSLFTGLTISEVLPRPAEGGDEWVELYNGSGMERRLCGWTLDDNEGGSAAFALDALRIGEGEHLVLPRPLTRIAFNDDADAARLIDPNGTVISVSYRNARSGESFSARDDGMWLWTPYPTPAQGNRFIPVRDVPRGLRIAAALPNTAGDDAGGEWFSVRNTSGRPMMLAGMSVASGTRSFAFGNDIALRSGEEKIFLADALGITLSNTRGSIGLRDSDGLLIDALSWQSAGDDEVIFMAPESEAFHGEVVAVNADATLNIGVPGPRPRDRFSRVERVPIGSVAIADRAAASVILESLLHDPRVSVLESGDIITHDGRSLADALVRRGIAQPDDDDDWQRVLAADARDQRLGMWADVADDQMSSVIVAGEPVLVASAGAMDMPRASAGDGTVRLRLSEAVAVPASGEEEWIEILCEQDTACDAGGWFADDIDGGSKPYRIPGGTVVLPDVPLVLPKSQTKLSLNDTGDDVRLLRPDATVADGMTFGKLPRGSAIARMGNATCITTVPTPGITPNHCVAVTQPAKPTKPTKPKKPTKSSSPKSDTAGQAAVRALLAKTTSGSTVETLADGLRSEKVVFPLWEAIFFVAATLVQVGLWRWLRRR